MLRTTTMGLVILLALAAGCGQDEEPSPEPPKQNPELSPFIASGPAEYREEVFSDMTHLVLPLVVYYHHVGELPTTEEGLKALIHGPDAEELVARFQGPYLPENMGDLFVDPWGREYVYRRTVGGERPIDLRSLGPDGIESEDDINYREFSTIADLIR